MQSRLRQFLLATMLACAAQAASAAPPVPLLWKVSDADNSVYLLGSFHLLKPGDYPLSRDVDDAFADSESVVFELPPDEIGSPALAIKMGQAALRTDGSQLDSDLSPTLRRQLQQWEEANAEALESIQSVILKIITEIAKERKANLVFQRSELVLFDNGFDVTDQVLTKLDEQLPTLTVSFATETPASAEAQPAKQPVKKKQ